MADHAGVPTPHGNQHSARASFQIRLVPRGHWSCSRCKGTGRTMLSRPRVALIAPVHNASKSVSDRESAGEAEVTLKNIMPFDAVGRFIKAGCVAFRWP